MRVIHEDEWVDLVWRPACDHPDTVVDEDEEYDLIVNRRFADGICDIRSHIINFTLESAS